MAQTVDLDPIKPITLPDGSVLQLAARLTPADQPPVVVPAVPRSVRVGAGPWFPLAAVNPSGGPFAGRGAGQLVMFDEASGSAVTRTNQWGAELPVTAAGVALPLNDRQPAQVLTGTSIPVRGRVLSGHGVARDYLLRWSSPGVAVELSADEAPGSSTSPDPAVPTAGGYPLRALSIYKMMYSTSPAFALDTAPPETNVVRLAFAVGSSPRLLGYGPEGEQRFKSTLSAWAASGRRVVVSCGGSGNATSTTDRAAFLAGVRAIRADLGPDNCHGWDWDIEKGTQTEDDLYALSMAMKEAYGDAWSISFVPGDIDLYRKVAARLAAAGALDEYGQQFYDAEVSEKAMMDRLAQAIDGGIPPERMSIGMMIAGDAKHWTNDVCVQRLAAARARYPGITKAYLWEGSRAGTARWAADMARGVAS